MPLAAHRDRSRRAFRPARARAVVPPLPRQHTLRGMIDWSFEPLAPTEQQLFARLGLFARGVHSRGGKRHLRRRCAKPFGAALPPSFRSRWSAWPKTAMAVCAIGSWKRCARTHWIAFASTGSTIVSRIASPSYFCASAKEADARYGRVTNSEFLAAVEMDLDNFRAALEWSLGQRNDTKIGAELAGAMGWIYRQSALFVEGARWAERGLAEVRDAAPIRRCAAAHGPQYFLPEHG